MVAAEVCRKNRLGVKTVTSFQISWGRDKSVTLQLESKTSRSVARSVSSLETLCTLAGSEFWLANSNLPNVSARVLITCIVGKEP